MSPFDQVLEREQEQENRIHTAVKALEDEKQSEEDALRAAHDATVEEARTKGREELVSFKKTHLPTVLQRGEDEVARNIARIKKEGSPRVAVAAKLVVDAALSPDFPSLL
jgi:hypothetical protein